jgi:type VI secretion system Hcp family effector
MKTSLRQLGIILLFALGIVPAAPGQATSNGVDMFLKLDNVKGSSTDPSFMNQMVVLNFEYGITSTATVATTQAGKSLAGDLVMTKILDMSTPVLAQAAASGSVYQQAVLAVRLNGQVVYIITLSEVRVRTVSQTAATTGSPSTPLTEKISLGYSKIEWAFGTTKAGYNFASNTKAAIPDNPNDENEGASVYPQNTESNPPVSSFK